MMHSGRSTSDPSAFRAALRDLVESAPEPEDHPSADQWLAYQRGTLPAAEEERLQEHLVRCRDCFDLAEGAAAFAAEDAADAPPRRTSWQSRLPLALAASLFVGMVGLTVWNLALQRELTDLRAPQPNPLIFDFAAGERLPTADAETVLPATPGPWVLVFHPASEQPVYRLTLFEAAGGVRYSGELRLDQNLTLTLHLPEGLPPGRYRLELADGSGGVLETHRVRVEAR
ncbi:MAG TPA: hypothetical protein DD490_05790 [Acidobacteria bacterium]|nr:hypothetical protein [Acidobacteriota bacterium]